MPLGPPEVEEEAGDRFKSLVLLLLLLILTLLLSPVLSLQLAMKSQKTGLGFVLGLRLFDGDWEDSFLVVPLFFKNMRQSTQFSNEPCIIFKLHYQIGLQQYINSPHINTPLTCDSVVVVGGLRSRYSCIIQSVLEPWGGFPL